MGDILNFYDLEKYTRVARANEGNIFILFPENSGF